VRQVIQNRRYIALSTLALVAGALASLETRLAVEALAVIGIVVICLSIDRLEHYVVLLFVVAMFYRAIAIAVGFWYFPVVLDTLVAVVTLAALLRPSTPSVSSVPLLASMGWSLFFGVALVELFNPNIPSALAAANGFRVTAYQAIAFWLGVRAFRNDDDFETLLRWMLLFGLLVLANGIRQLIWPLPLDSLFMEAARSSPDVFELTNRGLARRAFSVFPSPFALGYFGTLMSLISWYLGSVTKQSRYWIATAIAIAGALASLTRSTLFALLCAFVVVFVFSRKGFTRRLALIGLGTLLMGGLVVSLAHLIPTIGILFAVSRSPLTEPNFVARVGIWHDVWPMILRRPVVAYGVSSAGDALDYLYAGTGDFHTVPHNVLLKLLLELGVVGTAGFVALISAASVRALGSLKTERARLKGTFLIACMSGILAQGITGSAIESYPANLYFWFLVGVAARLKDHPSTPPGSTSSVNAS